MTTQNGKTPSDDATGTEPKVPGKARSDGKGFLLTVAVAAFAATVLASGILWQQTVAADKRAEAVKSETAAVQSAISELRAEPSVMATDLVERNRASLESSIERSKVQDYAQEFLRLRRDYRVDFEGFAFSNGKITTTVNASDNGGSEDPIGRIVKFIADFRSNEGSAKESPLSLGDVRMVSGEVDERSFSVEFEVRKSYVPNAKTDAAK